MKTVVTILAASAVLSASLCAGLAATDAASSRRTQTVDAAPTKAEAPAPRTAWIEPPAKAGAACRDAAWPYRSAVCAPKGEPGETPTRKVRVIPTNVPTSLAQR